MTTPTSAFRQGGGCLEIGGSPELRWPGFIGARYKPGGLLLVGNVHRNFASDKVPQWVPDLLVETTLALRADPVAHEAQYVLDTRRAYMQGLSGETGPTWNVARPFSHILQRLGLGWEDVAYTNASKAQLVPGADLSQVVEGCLRRWPLADLTARIDASMIITCSAAARDTVSTTSVPCLHFPQRFSYARLEAIVVEAQRSAKRA